MKKKSKTKMDDELRPEYDLRKLLKGGIRGKYAERYRAGTNLVLAGRSLARLPVQNRAWHSSTLRLRSRPARRFAVGATAEMARQAGRLWEPLAAPGV